MTAIFVAYQPDEQNLPVGEIILCERLNGIGCIRAFVINGNRFAAFDRDGNGLDKDSKGTKIMWSGHRPDHITGMNNILDWFVEEMLPTITRRAA